MKKHVSSSLPQLSGDEDFSQYSAINLVDLIEREEKMVANLEHTRRAGMEALWAEIQERQSRMAARVQRNANPIEELLSAGELQLVYDRLNDYAARLEARTRELQRREAQLEQLRQQLLIQVRRVA